MTSAVNTYHNHNLKQDMLLLLEYFKIIRDERLTNDLLQCGHGLRRENEHNRIVGKHSFDKETRQALSSSSSRSMKQGFDTYPCARNPDRRPACFDPRPAAEKSSGS